MINHVTVMSKVSNKKEEKLSEMGTLLQVTWLSRLPMSQKLVMHRRAECFYHLGVMNPNLVSELWL